MSGTSNPKFLALCIMAADGLLDSNDTGPEALNCVMLNCLHLSGIYRYQSSVPSESLFKPGTVLSA